MKHGRGIAVTALESVDECHKTIENMARLSEELRRIKDELETTG